MVEEETLFEEGKSRLSPDTLDYSFKRTKPLKYYEKINQKNEPGVTNTLSRLAYSNLFYLHYN